MLSTYDAILLNECSQIDNSTARKVVYAIDELPQKPFVAIAADYQQLQPVGDGGYMARICRRLPTVTLSTIYRTDDPDLLDFLNCARDDQPTRETLYDFFLDRRLAYSGADSL